MSWSRYAASIVATILASASVEAPAQPATHPPYPPTGTLIDVGGYRVHLNCIGTGRPTVVILGSGYSFDWSLVQAPISTVTRVCTYDPAGSAWSDPAPEVPTCNGRVLEIHRMLQNGGIDGPIVLVGHSIGAVFARMYADRYPAAVEGMVLSDHAGGYRLSPPPTPFGTTPVVRSEEQSLQKLPPAAQALHRWAAMLPHESGIPLFNRCIAQLNTSKATRPAALGNRPLVVIGNATLAASDDYRKKQSELLALSRKATSMTAATYGHDTPLEDPESLVRAIKRVVDDTRKP